MRWIQPSRGWFTKDKSSKWRRKVRGRKERSEAQCFCHSILNKLLLSLLFSKVGKLLTFLNWHDDNIILLDLKTGEKGEKWSQLLSNAFNATNSFSPYYKTADVRQKTGEKGEKWSSIKRDQSTSFSPYYKKKYSNFLSLSISKEASLQWFFF